MGCREEISRRRLMGVVGGAIVAGAIGSNACAADAGLPAPPEHCDASRLTPADKSLRDSLEYTDRSPFGDGRECRKCLSWAAGDAGACGGCSLIKGPVHPLGYCTSWELG